jgi:uncharacterized membrane protein YfcA
MIEPLYVVSGILVGTLVGLTGVGGGSLMTPILVLVFGIAPGTAVGTDLLFAAATKVAGTAVHGANRSIDWRVVGRLAAGSLPATVVTIYLLHDFGAPNPSTARVMSLVLGVALVLTALSLIFRTRIVDYFASRAARSPRPERPGRTLVLTVVTGAVLGVLVSLSSVGAGALGVTVLILLYPRLPVVRIVGSDIAHAVPLTLAAGIGHWFLGGTNWHLLASLLVGSVPAVIVSSYLSNRVPEPVLRPILAAVLLIVGARLVA